MRQNRHQLQLRPLRRLVQDPSEYDNSKESDIEILGQAERKGQDEVVHRDQYDEVVDGDQRYTQERVVTRSGRQVKLQVWRRDYALLDRGEDVT